MFSVRYYRAYLWVYLTVFIVLFFIAIIGDCVESLQGSIQISRTLSSFVVCVFSALSIYLFHKLLEKQLNLNLFKDSKNEWINSFMIYNKGKGKKTRFEKKFSIFGINLIVNLVNIFPLLLAFILGTVDVVQTSHSFLPFLLCATLLRYISGYITLFGFMGFFILNRDKELSYLRE